MRSRVGLQVWNTQKLVLLILERPAGTSLVVQGLRLQAPNAADLGLTPGQKTRSHIAATKSLHAASQIPHASTKTQLSERKEGRKEIKAGKGHCRGLQRKRG